MNDSQIELAAAKQFCIENIVDICKELNNIHCDGIRDSRLMDVAAAKFSMLSKCDAMQSIESVVHKELIGRILNTPLSHPLAQSKFDSRILHRVFKNIEKITTVHGKSIPHYVLCNECGSDVAQFACLDGKTWWFFIDNFPGQKKEFTTNLPVQSFIDFYNDTARCGIHLTFFDSLQIEPTDEKQGYI